MKKQRLTYPHTCSLISITVVTVPCTLLLLLSGALAQATPYSTVGAFEPVLGPCDINNKGHVAGVGLGGKHVLHLWLAHADYGLPAGHHSYRIPDEIDDFDVSSFSYRFIDRVDFADDGSVFLYRSTPILLNAGATDFKSRGPILDLGTVDEVNLKNIWPGLIFKDGDFRLVKDHNGEGRTNGYNMSSDGTIYAIPVGDPTNKPSFDIGRYAIEDFGGRRTSYELPVTIDTPNGPRWIDDPDNPGGILLNGNENFTWWVNTTYVTSGNRHGNRLAGETRSFGPAFGNTTGNQAIREYQVGLWGGAEFVPLPVPPHRIRYRDHRSDNPTIQVESVGPILAHDINDKDQVVMTGDDTSTVYYYLPAADYGIGAGLHEFTPHRRMVSGLEDIRNQVLKISEDGKIYKVGGPGSPVYFDIETQQVESFSKAITPDKGFTVFNVLAINDKGSIAAFGSHPDTGQATVVLSRVAAPSLVMGLTWDENIEQDGRLPDSTTFPATLSVRATNNGLESIDDITFENGELARFSPSGILSITSDFDTATAFSLQAGERREIPVELTTSALGRVTIRSSVAGISSDGTAVDASLEKNERVGFDLTVDVSTEVRSDEEGQKDSFVAFPAEGIDLEFDEAAGLPKPRDVKLTLEISNVSGDIADEAKLDVSTLVQTVEDRDPNAPDAMDIVGYVVGDGDPVMVDPAVAKVDEIPLGRIEVDGTVTVVVDAKAQNKGIVEASGFVLATGLSADPPHEPTRTLSGYGATELRIAQPVLLVVDGDPDSPGPVGVQRAGAEPWEFVGLVKNVSPDRTVDVTVLTEATGNVIGGPLRELLVEGGNPFGSRALIEPGETLTLYGRYLHHGDGGSHGKVEMHLYGKVEDEDAPGGVRPVLDSEIVVKEFGVDDFPATERQVRVDLRDPVPAAVEWTWSELGWTFTEDFTIGLATWAESNWELVENASERRISTFVWYATSVIWENRTVEEYNRIRDELAGYYQAIMDVDAAEAGAAVENAIQNKILEVASRWETGDVPYFVGATGSFLGEYVPDLVVTEGMIARAATIRHMRYHGASAMARAEAAQVQSMIGRLAAHGRRGFRGGDPISVAEAYTYWGMDPDLDAALRAYCKRKNIIVAMRDRSPGSVAKLRQGLLGKIESVKSKNVNQLDLHLGFHKDHLDTAMFKRMRDWGYYRDKLPDELRNDDDFVANLKARWAERAKEWRKEAPKNDGFEKSGWLPTPPKQYGMNIVDNGYPELKDVPWEQRRFELGRTRSEGNRPADLTETTDGMPAYQPRVWTEGDGFPEGFRAFTGDMDMIAVTDVNGRLLSKKRRKEVYRELAELGFEHPESLTWDNRKGRAGYVADYDVRVEGSDALLGYGPDGLSRAIKLDSGKLDLDAIEVTSRFLLLQGAKYDWNGEPPTANPENSTDNIPDTVDALDHDAPDPLGDPNIYLGVGDADFDATSDAPLLRLRPGGNYERYDATTKDWVPYTPPQGQPVSQLPQSSLTSYLSPGDTLIPIIGQDNMSLPIAVAQDWFEPGQTVVINPGGDNEERRTVQALGSIIVTEPLQYAHAAGEIIAVSPGSDAQPAATGIFADLPWLSEAARGSLIAHFDGRAGVVTTEGSRDVESWTPFDGVGSPLPAMQLTNMGTGNPGLITYDGIGTLNFDDDGRNERFLRGLLSNAGGSEMTVVWYGHYDSGNPSENSGAYAFNIGLNDLSHQRDNLSGGRFAVELYNGTTYSGTIDISPLDGIDTVWTTTVTADSHTAWAGSVDLGIKGSPAYNIRAGAEIFLGAFSPSGFDFVGDMKQLVIFESALDETDRLMLQDYFEGGLKPIIPQAPVLALVDGMIEISWSGRNVVLQRSTDQIHWETLPDALSPLTVSPAPEGREFYRLAYF